MSYTNAAKLGVQHGEWLKTLDFYKDELDIMKSRLLEVAGKNSGKQMTAGLEHFQNQFIIQRNSIDEFKQAVNEHGHQAYEDAEKHAGKIEKKLFAQHIDIEDKVKQLEKVINILRHKFNTYLAKWM